MIETAVLISIKPKLAGKILRGDKTVEDRKTAPAMYVKVPCPFVCYIYESGTGMVTGEFSCDAVEALTEIFTGKALHPCNGEDCLTEAERLAYSNGKEIYGWHVMEALEYTEPILLSAFCGLDGNPIKKPPQSWRYVMRRRKQEANGRWGYV